MKKAGGMRSTATPERSEPTTLANEAYLRLREDIIGGSFPAGKPLRLEALKARYGYSFSPLREALNRLQSERLVELSALRGFRMAGLSLEEMWDAIETRILIEAQALRLSLRHGGVDWETRVVATFYSLSRSAPPTGTEPDTDAAAFHELERRHYDFHSALIAASGSRWLSEFADQLYAQTERYRRPILKASGAVLSQRNVIGEHKDLMDAALARDDAGAVELLGEHYRRTGKVIEAQLLDAPEMDANAAAARYIELPKGLKLKRTKSQVVG